MKFSCINKIDHFPTLLVMKTKLLLILSLVVPSLCFGLSTNLRVVFDKESKVCKLVLDSSKTLNTKEPYSYSLVFVCRKDLKIYKADNDNYKLLSGIIKIHFPKFNEFFDDPISISVPSMCAMLRKIAIWNNYMITYTDMDSDGDDITFDLFLYKLD